MKAMLDSPAEFASLLQSYFMDRLLQQQAVSARTIASYRDAFRLLLAYAQDKHGIAPESMALGRFDVKLVLGFLEYLESERGNTIRSRNSRLAAIRGFARYVTLQCPDALMIAQQILAIPMKRHVKPLLGFLSRAEVKAILSASDSGKWSSRRDLVMLRLLYNTGARVSELIGIHVRDLDLGAASSVRLHGKGRKQRSVPLWKETASALKRWIQDESLTQNQPLVPNRWGGQMTRANVSERIKQAVNAAIPTCPSLADKHVSPHTFRHTTAMHLLQGGVDITVIALWLGHESPVTTHGYIEADLAMKERALGAITPPSVRQSRYRPQDKLLKFLQSL